MAPGPKRKRSERNSVDSGEHRPSPHRPGNSNLAQHDRGQDSQDRGGGRRSSRGGQGGQGRGGRRNDRGGGGGENQNKPTVSARATPTPGPMSPPPLRPASATQTPNPIVDPPSPITKPDPLPFDYMFLTDDRISSWDTTGRQEVIAVGNQALLDEDAADLSILFQELIRATLDVRIDAADAGNCVKEILGPDSAPVDETSVAFDPETLFLDTLSMMVDAEPGATESKSFPKVLRAFTPATGVSPISMRQKLDATLLQNLGLTRDTFIRVGIRQATHLLYRQANYNLLREETEGYSKLLTELFTTSGSEPPSAEVVAETFEKVKGLIGTFDLDVGRVLDITMDVFAAVLIKHFRFFIKLLRVSSWWPRNGETDSAAASRCNGLPKWALPESAGWFTSEGDEEISQRKRVIRDTAFWQRAREVGIDAFFELGGRDVVDAETKKRLFGGKGAGDAELDADCQWIESTGTFPPSGNRTAAQLLGFKLRFYSSAARNKEDILPPNLLYLTALLIKIGFISLRDLYPHLFPFDEDMDAFREKKTKELEEKEKLNRPGGATNALMMAGALVDDTLPNGGRSRETVASKSDPLAKASTDVEDKDKLDEPDDQKVLLLTCLLTIGAIPESLYILGRFPWLTEVCPEILDLIHRILNYSIKDVYDMSRPTTSQPFECTTREMVDPDQGGVPKGQVRLVQSPAKKLLRWPYPDKHDTNESNSYRFYWDEWADNVPVCQNVDDVFTLCGTLLNYSGVNIGKDSSLLSKLARIGVKSLSTDPSQSNLDRWQDLLKRLLVPALSLTKANTSVVNEIYDMLRFYPVSIRYLIYAEWFEGQTSRLPAMKAAFARTRLETLGIMKRISMTNLTAMARSLAKTAYASPGIVFTVALSQIEAYTNLTEVVVECAKYFTDLGYDVLVWSLMSSLGGKDRNRNNSEFALLPSRWLLALSRFSGKVFKRYSIMNLSPIVQYVNDQLYRGNSTDLVILKELIAQMAGVVPDTDFTDSQLTAMTGGELLRKQTLINLQDKRYESTKTAKRLMRALTETKLAGQLLLSIAQHRQSAIYTISDEDAHIKLLATMVDDSQLILFQYLDLLRSNLSVEEFDSHVPNISELLTDFGLDAPLAFMIGRASLAHRMERIASPIMNGVSEVAATVEEPSPMKIDGEGDVGMGDGTDTATATPAPQTSDIAPSITNGETPVPDDVQMVELKETSPSPVDLPDASNPSTDDFDEVLHPIITTVQNMVPDDSWKAITSTFYVTFWTATLGDLAFPSKSYEVEISRLMAEQRASLKDRSDMSRSGMTKKEEFRKANEETREALSAEFGKGVGAYRQKKARLLKHKAQWFMPSVKADYVSDAILEKCIIPRVLLSPNDADFCFKMIKFLHENGTPHFRTLSVYGRLFKANRLRSIIFTCTVREAENLGRFLKLVLVDLGRWHADVRLYEREAWGSNKNLPGFAKALDDEGKPKGLFEHDGKGPACFKSVLLTWHKGLNSALRDCLEGTEWMHIRNAITILKQLVDVFPAIDFMGKGFMKQLEIVAKREKDVREDLSLTGNAVLVQMKKKAFKWVMVQAFSSNAPVPPQANGGSAAKSTPPPTSTTPKSNLKPTAPEFKPLSRASSVGVSTPKPTTTEVEDGEVDDAKIASTAAKVAAAASSEPKPLDTAAPVASEVAPKSEVLARREQHLREKNAKSISTPPPASIPGRPETARNTSSSVLDRNNPRLPNRPDVSFPSHRDLERDRHQPRHGDRRDDRNSRLPDPNRLERPGDRPRDFQGPDRREPEPSSRDFGRPLDRLERPRTRPDPPPRWTPESARENQERAMNANRPVDNSGRLSRDNMPPPRVSGVSADRGPPNSSDRTPLVNAERQEIINPERAALITGSKTPPRSDSPRRPREEPRNPRDRTSSRPQSPRRHGSERDDIHGRRDDRSTRNAPEAHNSSHSRTEENLSPPAGPRSERASEKGNERGSMDRVRDASTFQPPLPPQRSMDPEHGRLNSNSRHQADPNFGRLNPTPASDIPLGPRDRNQNQRGGRMASGPQRRDGRPALETPRPPTPPEKAVPTGPSSNRQPRRSASGQFDSASNPNSAVPTTPLSASAAPPIHPDRLRHLGSAAQPPAPPLPPLQSMQAPVGVHPDRLKAFNESGPSGQQSNNNHKRPPMPSLVTAVPPSGPKGSHASPVSSGANGLTAPTGPASAVERTRGGRRQLAGINNMLQQAGQQNPPDRLNVRGRGRINSAAQGETQNSAPSTPTIPPPPPPPPGPPPAAANRDIINPERADLITGNAPSNPNEERERDRTGRRSGRHSRRSSRSPQGGERNRDSKRGPTEDERGGRDHRDRRESGRSDPIERDRHQPRDPARELIASSRDPNSRDGGRERERERERERDPARRDARDREGGRELHEPWGAGERGDRGGGERGGRNRDPRGDDRRSRTDEGGRKRRSDGDGLERGHDKRPRR